MNNLTRQIIEKSPLCKLHFAEIDSCIKFKTFKKGEYIVNHDSVCRYLYFINEGLAKISFFSDGKERIMRFFNKGELLSILDSFIQQKTSKYTIQAIETTEVLCISYTDLIRLSEQHHCFENYYRKTLEFATVKMMGRIFDFLEKPPVERYKIFLEENKEIVNRISLGDVSKYIGISQVSLSRIRAKIRF